MEYSNIFLKNSKIFYASYLKEDPRVPNRKQLTHIHSVFVDIELGRIQQFPHILELWNLCYFIYKRKKVSLAITDFMSVLLPSHQNKYIHCGYFLLGERFVLFNFTDFLCINACSGYILKDTGIDSSQDSCITFLLATT